MSGCNATLAIGDETVHCHQHVDGHTVWDLPVHRGAPDHIEVQWDDEAPGAKPHTPPRYRVEVRPSGVCVVVGGLDEGWRAMFHPQRHPDPLDAAEAEAARLNVEDPPWKATLDAALALAIEQREELKRERDMALTARETWEEEARAQRADADAFRAALEKIKRTTNDWQARNDAHEALEGRR